MKILKYINEQNFSDYEHKIIKKLNSPIKIQDFLNRLEHNAENDGITLHSPRYVINRKSCHCIEGALLAAFALWYHGERPIIMDLKSNAYDFDHVVALYKKNGHWGAISKTNHAVLRYRDPVYETIRELALSYFHEYFLDDGSKTLRSYSDPFDLSRLEDKSWIISDKNLWYISKLLDRSPHHPILDPSMIRGLRRADAIEIKAGKLLEYARR